MTPRNWKGISFFQTAYVNKYYLLSLFVHLLETAIIQQLNMSDNNIILLENASIFQNDHLVLNNVDFKLDKGEFVYLIGYTGSGKSSLLKTLYGDLPLQKGLGNILGFDLTSLKTKQIPLLRRKLGVVFQDFQLLTDRSVENNLLFVLKATGWKDKLAMSKRISEVLEKVGMGTKSHKMPFQLSGGEQQRIAIARALLNDPELILADEPTGNLDPNTSQDILALLREISGSGRAVLMATHDYNLMDSFPSRTLKCVGGKVEESKTTVATSELN
ncbi:MAG: cell division transport system ATP-binding protein [Candidatus Azotimanducaceae bacterium]|jgi:cell division transport system ATP-binding protein